MGPPSSLMVDGGSGTARLASHAPATVCRLFGFLRPALGAPHLLRRLLRSAQHRAEHDRVRCRGVEAES